MKEFFENLRQIRLDKGISLDEMSQKSRLSLKFLKDIENGNLENLPQGYDRIFFKRYLKEIGEDKEEVWRDFNLFFGSGPLEKDVPYSSDIPREDQKKTEVQEEMDDVEINEEPSILQKITIHLNMDKLHRYFWIFLTVIVMAVVGYFAYQQYIFVKSIPPEIKEISVSEYISEMQQQDSLLTPKISQDTEIKGNNVGDVVVELQSLERTWVREIRDMQDTTEYILIQGLKRKIQAAESVRLMLGRADGVKIWLNGDSLGVMGDADEVVVNLLLTDQGVVEKRLKKPAVKAEPAPDTGQVSVEDSNPGESSVSN